MYLICNRVWMHVVVHVLHGRKLYINVINTYARSYLNMENISIIMVVHQNCK